MNHCAADHIAGVRSILDGIAVNIFFATGHVVNVDDVIKLP
jgi:hypothetical protein